MCIRDSSSTAAVSRLLRNNRVSGFIRLACIIHEDSASRLIIAKQVARSPEKRGLPRDEGDRLRCDAIMASGVEWTVRNIENTAIRLPNSMFIGKN